MTAGRAVRLAGWGVHDVASGLGCGPGRSLTLEMEGNGMMVQVMLLVEVLRPGVGAPGRRHLRAPASGR